MKEDVYFSTKTENRSFLDMWRYLQDTLPEIDSSFMLKCYNSKLHNIPAGAFYDSHDYMEFLDEGKRNIWFFFRELICQPSILDPYGKYQYHKIQFPLSKLSLAMIYCYDLGIPAVFVVPPDTMTAYEAKITFHLIEIYHYFRNSNNIPDNIYHYYDNVNAAGKEKESKIASKIASEIDPVLFGEFWDIVRPKAIKLIRISSPKVPNIPSNSFCFQYHMLEGSPKELLLFHLKIREKYLQSKGIHFLSLVSKDAMPTTIPSEDEELYQVLSDAIYYKRDLTNSHFLYRDFTEASSDRIISQKIQLFNCKKNPDE